MQFGTNHVGHFLLTCLLVPQLLADPPSRVVNLSSGGHRGSDIVWDDPNFERREYDKFAAYGQSKTANILFSVELDRRLGDRGVHAYAVHPGMIATELGRHMTQDDFAAHGGAGQGGAVGRTAAAQDRRAGRGDVGVGRDRPRARRPGRHLPRRLPRSPTSTRPGPATPSRPPASGPSPRTWSARQLRLTRDVAGLKQVIRVRRRWTTWPAIQRGLEQLDRLRASRNGHAGLAAAAGVDLSRPAYALLRRIDEHGPPPLGELARATGMDAASTGRQVRRLEELGFVERVPERRRRPRRRRRDHPRRARRAPAHRRGARSAPARHARPVVGRRPPRARRAAARGSSTTSATSNSATRHA